MSVFVATHMGLGDMILQNGLIRTLAESEDIVFVPCIEKYRESAVQMYMDNAGIVVVVVPDSMDAVRNIAKHHGKHLLLGRFNPKGYKAEGCRFDEVFYDQAGVPFEFKWSKFKVGYHTPMACEVTSPYAFVHDDPSRNLIIDVTRIGIGLEIKRPHITSSLWHHWNLLIGATEVHCITSAFMCWVDCQNMTMKKFAHLYARPFEDCRDDITRTKDWIEFV